MQGGVGIPHIRWAGSEGDYNVLVSKNHLGVSLLLVLHFVPKRRHQEAHKFA